LPFGRKTRKPEVTHSASPVLTHRIATHLNAVSIVDEAVENTVGQCRVADLLVPARNREL
jgi:hypothetical protein